MGMPAMGPMCSARSSLVASGRPKQQGDQFSGKSHRGVIVRLPKLDAGQMRGNTVERIVSRRL